MIKFLKKIFKPHNPYLEDNINHPFCPMGKALMRCDCGALLWNISPQEVMKKHVGHRMKMAISGSLWEWVKIKMEWIA